jgi:hypothetical protein
MMRIRWLRTALAQIIELPSWIEQDFPGAGSDTVAQKVRTIIGTIKELAADPAKASSRAGRIAGTREQPLLFDHYTLIYRVRNPAFEVLGILPTSRKS